MSFEPLRLMGAPGSPYTRKMVALLRYRRIPYEILWGSHTRPMEGLPQPKVKLLPTAYFPGADGLEAVVDSTVIIRRLEADHTARSVLPPDPALRLIDFLLEDFADEWLTKAMFHYRWAHEDDIANAGPLLAFWQDPTLSDEGVAEFAAAFARRQIDRLYVVGSNAVTGATIEESFRRTVDILNRVVEAQGYLLGARPASSDFAVYGQMTQLGVVDPTPARETAQRSPRLRAWLDRMEDLSGLAVEDDHWIDLGRDSATLRPLLSEVGRVYVPFLIANAEALAQGREQVETQIDGRPWTQPVFPYQAKCLAWLREAYGSLDASSRERVDRAWAGTGCERIIG